MIKTDNLNFKLHNTENDRRLRKILGIDHRDDIIVLCRDSQQFGNGSIVVRPDAVLWEVNTYNFTVVEFKSRDLHGDNTSLYEYFQTIIEAHVVECVLENMVGKSINVKPLLLYGNGRKVYLGIGDENIIEMYIALEEMDKPLPVPGSQIAMHIVRNAPNEEDITANDTNARQRGIDLHNWLLNSSEKN